MSAITTPVLCLAAAAVAAHAGDRASSDYAVAADDTSSAGQRASSANYSADQSLTDSGGTGGSGDYQTRQGYTGQLYDAASLNLGAAPAMIGETATSQLTATLVHDDGTQAPLFAGSVAWSIVSGPVQSISAAGVLTPQAVWTNSAARIQATRGLLTSFADLTILDTNADNYHNYAADGIPDSWQAEFFGPDNPSGEAGADPDADGQTNLFEYCAGLQPNNSLSRFEISIAVTGDTHRDIGFGPLAAGRTYLLESSTDLKLWEQIPGAAPVSDDGHWRILQDRRATEPRKFYRINISIPE